MTITTPPPAAGIRPFPACPACGTVFAEVRGARLHVAEAGAGEPAVLLHGFPGIRRPTAALAIKRQPAWPSE